MTEQPQSSTLPQQRVMRVFVSSTFRDMKAERDELVLHIFPQLRKLCESRGVTWGEVDLRWGITEEEAAEGKILPICLAEIERCRPYFIGILGEHYGWVPEAIPQELITREPWLAEHRIHSVTELEILHGVLRNPEMADHAFFYFRDPSYLQCLPSEWLADFLPENPEAAAKLQALKARIRESGLPVRENYKDPQQLGEWLLEDFTRLIETRFPESQLPDPLAREAADHDAFARSRTRVCIGRQMYFDRLDAHVQGDGPPLIILGESGIGKSALLAKWFLHYREQHPNNFALIHFIGATPASADWAALLRRILLELKRRFDLPGETPLDPFKLRAAFQDALTEIPASYRIVLVLDALNQLEDRDGAPDLGWLPEALPSNCRVILSTLPGRSLDALRRWQWPALTVEPLDEKERLKLLWRFLRQYRKRLSKDQRRRIVTAPQTANPLFLSVLLDELRQFGDYEHLHERIEHYLAAEDPKALYERIIERWVQDYGGALVHDSLSLIWAARRGLSEAELLDLLGQDNQPLPRAFWTPFSLAAESALLNRAGLLNFSHAYAQAAVESIWLGTGEPKEEVHGRLADYFYQKVKPTADAPWDLHYPRALSELPYHYLHAAHFDKSYALARDEAFLTAQRDAFPDDPDMPLQTIRYALQAAAERDDASGMAEFLLDHPRRLVKTSHESPVEALRRGNLKRAWQLADLYDTERSVIWHLLLAWVCLDMRDPTAAWQTLHRLEQSKELAPLNSKEATHDACTILPYLAGINEYIFMSLMKRLLDNSDCAGLVSGLVKAGELDLALKTARVIKHDLWRTRALCILAEAGDPPADNVIFAAALQTAQAERQLDALRAFAATQCQAGDFAGAVQTAQAIPSAGDRRWVLRDVAAAQTNADDFVGALETVLALDDAYQRADALCDIAAALARAGHFAIALRVAQAIEKAPSRAQGLGEIAVALAQMGNRPEAEAIFAIALQMARAIDEGFFRAWALREIAVTQAQAGDQPSAEATFAEARQAAKAINDSPWWRIMTLRELATAQAHAGDFTGAVQTVRALDEGFARAKALGELAIAQADAGDQPSAEATCTDALQTARAIKDSYFRSQVLRDVAAAQARAGDFGGALQTAWTMDELLSRADALREIAAAQAQAGDFAGALQTARALDNHGGRAKALRELAAVQAQAGDFAGALQTARAIKDSYFRSQVLGALAAAQAKAGDFGGARQTAWVIDELGSRVDALRELAAVQAQAGDFTGALQTAQALDDAYQQAWLLRKIGVAQAHAGNAQAAQASFAEALQKAPDFDDADQRGRALCALAVIQAQAGNRLATETILADTLRMARGIKNFGERALVLGEIAAAQAQVGDPQAAHAAFGEAVQTARGIDEADQRDEVLSKLAAAQLEVGDFAGALQTARGIHYAYVRGKALRDLAGAQAQAGDFDDALQTARAIELAYIRAEALQALAASKAQAGVHPGAFEAIFAEALQALQTEDEVALRAPGLQALAETQADAGYFGGALQAARAVEDAERRAGALGHIAAAQARVGDFADALPLARAVEDAHSRAWALGEIAVAQAQAGDYAGALQTARTIDNLYQQAKALQGIATAQIRASDFADALQTARAIINLYLRAESLRDLATAQSRAGDRQTAHATFAEALQVARTIRGINGFHERAKALREIAAAQAQADDPQAAHATFAEALQVARDIPANGNDYSIRASALRDLATALARAGDRRAAETTFAEALQTARALGIAHWRDEALRKMAVAQAQAGLVEASIQAASQAGDPEALSQLGTLLVEHNDKENFNRLLVPCAYSLASATEASLNLARLYPEQASGVGLVILASLNE